MQHFFPGSLEKLKNGKKRDFYAKKSIFILKSTIFSLVRPDSTTRDEAGAARDRLAHL